MIETNCLSMIHFTIDNIFTIVEVLAFWTHFLFLVQYRLHWYITHPYSLHPSYSNLKDVIMLLSLGYSMPVHVLAQRIADICQVHYTTLHYTTLHYTTLHYTTLHHTTPHHTTLHYTYKKQYTYIYTSYNFFTVLIHHIVRADSSEAVSGLINLIIMLLKYWK